MADDKRHRGQKAPGQPSPGTAEKARLVPRGTGTSRRSAIELGEKDLRITTLVKLANTFKISVGQLFRG
jgi:hypothetical protein